MTGLPEYSECQISREPPPVNVDKDADEIVGKDFDVLPLFEKCIFEYKYRQYYSLENNKFLHCRWRSYLETYDDRQFSPFTFVDRRDFHFYNGMNRLLPSESFHRKTNFPFKLKEGPGVDFRGQMPIPQDMQMKREKSKPKAKGKSNNLKTTTNPSKTIDKKSVI